MAVNYGWKIKVKNELQAVEMDYLRSSSRKSKLEGAPNEETRRIVQAEEIVLDRIDARKLRWFGHVMRMPEERWPAIIHSWIPPGRRKRGRPRSGVGNLFMLEGRINLAVIK
jgi:hypothetical protein